MIWAGAVMIWAGACSNTNFPTLKVPKNAKKAKCDGPTDRPTDRRTDRPTRGLIGRVPATKRLETIRGGTRKELKKQKRETKIAIKELTKILAREDNH